MNILESKATFNPQVFISLDSSLILNYRFKKRNSKLVAANFNSPTIVMVNLSKGLAT